MLKNFVGFNGINFYAEMKWSEYVLSFYTMTTNCLMIIIFSRILNWYFGFGWTDYHPYYNTIEGNPLVTSDSELSSQNWT